MKSQVIYFDFDRTLLDTDSLKQEQARRIAKIAQLSEEQVYQGMQQYIESIPNHLYFDVGGYALFLGNLYDINPSDVTKIYLTDCNYIADFLFPETLEVLKKLSREGYSLGIFSSAVPGHQKIKIENTGVLEYIPWSSVIISPNKLDTDIVAKIPNNTIVIDDDRTIIVELLEKHPHLTPVWCNRKTDEKIYGIRTIKNLSELLEA
ncbi:HAD hydrolase-like protein [bacterium]|nr:HAD hydrolase-like protein [bacterium]